MRCCRVVRFRQVTQLPQGRVAPGRYRPGAPTDPYVRALPHTVLRSTDSPSAMVPEAIRSSDGDMLIEPRCARHVSLNRVCRPTLRFPPQGPPGRVPLLQRYYQSATTSCHSSRRTSFPSFGGTSAFTRSVRSPADECTAGAWSWSPDVSSRDLAEETTGPPKFLGNPNCPFAHDPIRLRRDCLHQTITVQQCGPCLNKDKGSHERSFEAQ